MGTKPTTAWALFAAVAVATAVTACDGSTDGGEQLTVVATTTIVGEVVTAVVGDDATVTVLTPSGADPHDFQPSSAQVALINDADLVVSIGLGLEEGLIDTLEGAGRDGVNILELAPSLNPLPFDSDHEEEVDDHDHEGSLDPHVWFDPQRIATAADLVAAELVKLDGTVPWQDRANSYRAELEMLDADIRAILDAVPASSRSLVTNHDSLGYLADRYGFDIVGTVIPSGASLGAPSSEELASLVNLMRELGVTAIFADTTLSTELAAAVAEELGSSVEVVDLYTGSLGEPGSGAETLPALLRVNAERIAAALGG